QPNGFVSNAIHIKLQWLLLVGVITIIIVLIAIKGLRKLTGFGMAYLFIQCHRCKKATKPTPSTT
ncbi:MAG: hypothetical protein CMO57_05750, partial [Verrucomicrobiales bacterium]|nr:hypothetical protein [Verrucomicrobiales bacterium]